MGVAIKGNKNGIGLRIGQPIVGAFGPRHLARSGGLFPQLFQLLFVLPGAFTQLKVFDLVGGCLNDHGPHRVVAGASGAARDLVELAGL